MEIWQFGNVKGGQRLGFHFLGGDGRGLEGVWFIDSDISPPPFLAIKKFWKFRGREGVVVFASLLDIYLFRYPRFQNNHIFLFSFSPSSSFSFPSVPLCVFFHLDNFSATELFLTNAHISILHSCAKIDFRGFRYRWKGNRICLKKTWYQMFFFFLEMGVRVCLC